MATKKVDYETFDDPEEQCIDEQHGCGDRETDSDEELTTRKKPNVPKTAAASLVFPGVYTAEDRERVEQMYNGRVVFPWHKWYKAWWGLTVFMALFTLFFVTYQVAFSSAGLFPYNDASSIIEYTTLAIFVADIPLNFNIAFYNNRDEICCDRKLIAQRYMSKMFWLDLLGVLPFYPVALAIAGELGNDSTLSQYLAFFRLVRLVRLHRLKQVLEFMQYTTCVSLMWLTLLRNFAVAMVWAHLAACIFYFIARQFSFDPDETWLGAKVQELEPLERYTTSLYWSVVTFTTVGYGDFSPVNSVEQIFGMIYMMSNIILQSWIIGSITLLVVKADEKTAGYRSNLQTLETYSTLHNFDDGFEKRLRRQLKLDFNNREVADEQVLRHFPTAVRSRVLRKLYLPSLSKTTLLRGTRQQFVDAFLATCKVEMFSPGEEILQRGSIASDLYLLVSGSATASTYDPKVDHLGRGGASGSLVESEFDGSTKRIESGHFINEVGFFTESPQIETVRTVGVCKTLTMPRAGYKLIADDHPGSAGKILENLLQKVETQAKPGANEATSLPTKLELLRAGSVFEGLSAKEESTAIEAEEHAKAALSTTKDLIAMHIEKQKDDQTTRFLFAASRGDMGTITLMCDQGFDPNCADYDSRTALMVAAMKGNTDVVKQLLKYGADPNLVDMHGSSALYETVKNGHESTMDILLKQNATLCMDENIAASTLCQAVFDGDILTLRRLLRADIDVNALDYDRRSAAHIAAAEGNAAALRVLQDFDADFSLCDRWGNKAIDEVNPSHEKSLEQAKS